MARTISPERLAKMLNDIADRRDTSAPGRQKHLALEILRAVGEPMTLEELAEVMAVRPAYLTNTNGALTLLIAEGKVGRKSRGISGGGRYYLYYADPTIELL